MNISAKIEYACIAVLELARRYASGEPVRVRTIADSHGIPNRFLVQILLQLKGVGLVSSTRGASGGYQLIKDPQEITLGEVMAVIEGPTDKIKLNSPGDTPTSRALLEAWEEVARVQHKMLHSVTFADLAKKAGEGDENMYYI